MEKIYESIWILSPHVSDRATYTELTRLTRQLIKLCDSDNQLERHPFSSARERKLSLPFEKINNELRGSICLVTGGLGCVGSSLVKELLRFNVKRIIILDNYEGPSAYTAAIHKGNVVHVACDILDLQAVESAFSVHRPDFVFHTAAQRDPGYAETYIVHTVQTNVLGTLNIVKACERIGTVKQCVFSSTGKSSRYFTEEIYAATKKICEFILATYSKESSIKYSMVRFTHILDNSLMDRQLRDASNNQNYVAVHSPGKFVTAQNVGEAACLMLNALIYSEDRQCKFLLVRNLEWPTESLQMALYHIKHSGRDIPAIFQGNPNGYTEKFFRGQLDWSDPAELNLLINVYENKHRSHNQDEDIVISHICPINKATLEKVLYKLQTAEGEEETQKCLVEGLKELVRDMLQGVAKKETMNILNWGLEPQLLEIAKANVSDYGVMIPLLLESLEGSEYHNQAENLIHGRKLLVNSVTS